MAKADWKQVTEIFYEALSHPVAERPRFLQKTCGLNDSLRSEIELLLDSYESGFLENSIVTNLVAKPKAETHHFEEGDEFSHYRIVRLLGRGGMGEVYLAADTSLDRHVAIKMVHRSLDPQYAGGARLLKEARAVAKLDHPNIAAVYEVGEVKGLPFISMQYVKGRTLDEILKGGGISPVEAVRYARQIAAALIKAHASRLVHGDIKPSNLIVDDTGILRVLDFGLVKEITSDSTTSDQQEPAAVAGTIAYMSPEHLEGKDIDGRADVWSLGVVLCQMLTGRQPFRGETRSELIAAIREGQFDRVADAPRRCSALTEQILARALAKDRSLRYASIADFNEDLARLLERLQENPPFLRPWTAAIAVFILIALGAFSTWQFGVVGESASDILHAQAGSTRIDRLFDIKRRAGGAITDLSFSPDGQTVLFTLWGEGPTRIYTMPIAGGEPEPLGDATEDEWSPVWSPDGAEVAFLTRRREQLMVVTRQVSGHSATRQIPVSGGSNNVVLRRWSMTGPRVYAQHDDGPHVIDLDSGNTIPLDVNGIAGSIHAFSVSPDESQMIAVTGSQGLEKLWIKDFVTGEAKWVSETSPRNGVPSWFPHNAGYAYSADDNGSFQIFVKKLDSSAPRQLTFGNFSASHPVISPDGRRLAYVTNLDEANILRAGVATGELTAVTASVNLQLFPDISPDGQRIVYQTSDETSKLTAGHLKLDLLTSAPTKYPQDLRLMGCFARWSPTGDQIAYLRRVGTSFELFRSSTAEPREVLVTSGGISMPGIGLAPFEMDYRPFDWARDGAALVYSAKRSDAFNLWRTGIDGHTEPLTAFDGSSRPTSPLYSPDGRKLAFIEALASGPALMAHGNNVDVIVDGQIRRLATFGRGVSLLNWDHAGEVVFAAVDAPGSVDVFAVSAESKRIVRLPNARRESVRLSPDARWVAYSVSRKSVENLCVTELMTSDERCVTSNDDPTVFFSGIVWAPDSKTVFFTKQTGGMQISLISLNHQENDPL